jgi:hypothetical protein
MCRSAIGAALSLFHNEAAGLRSFFAPRSRPDGTVRMGVVFRRYLAERAR